uniref:hypothetical protein n=1 Tax=Gemmata sp. SH-PL17 TaxID=1630693 RepID=UPI00078E095E|nr:hypothetical protein [Gemmata sp. SH-PL17]AMV25538.1 hypothetical protein VT84_14160 [Gemmata sp. SH-PL17]
MIIAIDFDGTIAEHEFPDIGAPVPGAFEWMKRWQDAGAKLILWTMRSDGRSADGSRENGPVLTEAVEFCRRNGVEFYGVNGNPGQASWTQSPKAYAHVYVDDAAFGCPLRESRKAGNRPMVDWSVVGPAIHAMLRPPTSSPAEVNN